MLEKSYIPHLKALSSGKTELKKNRKKIAMRGATPVLLKVLLFLKVGVATLKNDAMPNFISVSNSSILGLSNGISFVSEFYLEGG